MLRRTLLPLVLLASVVGAPMQAKAATVRLDMHNCYFTPWSIVAAPGDTVEIRNLGGTKTVQSYKGQQFGPVTVATNGTASFVYDGTAVGLVANDFDPRGSCRGSSPDGVSCTGMCANVTATPPSDPPSTPTIASPAENASLSSTTVMFSGTVSNAVKVRITVQPLNQTFDGQVSGSSWSASRLLSNGSYTATVTAVHQQGFESAASSVNFTVASSGDSAPPVVLPGNPMRLMGAPTPLQFGQVYAGHGYIEVNGVLRDDKEAKQVTATIKNALVPGAEAQPVPLTCYNPDAGGTAVPCNATTTTNPWRISYRGTHFQLQPGHYLITVTGKDGAGNEHSVIQDVIIFSPF